MDRPILEVIVSLTNIYTGTSARSRRGSMWIHLQGCGVTFRDARNALRCASISPGINCTCRRADRFVTFMICVRCSDVVVCTVQIRNSARVSNVQRCATSGYSCVTWRSRRFGRQTRRCEVSGCSRLPSFRESLLPQTCFYLKLIILFTLVAHFKRKTYTRLPMMKFPAIHHHTLIVMCSKISIIILTKLPAQNVTCM